MARNLKEIRNFNHGIFLNASESDIPEDAASFSLNVNPETEDGILGAIKTNKLFAITNTDTIKSTLPVPWGYSGNTDSQALNHIDIMKFKGINAFKNKRTVNVSVNGTKGRTETLALSDPRPHFEEIWKDNTAYKYTWKPNFSVAASDTSFTILSNANTITDSTISNWTVAGFDGAGEATITIGGNTLSDYDGETFVVLTPDGKSVTYQFDSTDGGTATGALIATTNCCVQIFNASPTVSTIAAQVQAAIENTTNGHGVRIAITRDTGVLTLTLRHRTLGEHLQVGQYITLFEGTWDSETDEIMQITSISETSIGVVRGCFDSPISYAYASGTTYSLMANLATVSGSNVQVLSSDFYCNIAEWSNYSGNNIGGGGRHWMYASNTNGEIDNGFITSSSAYVITFNATNKTVVFEDRAPSFNEGDRVTFYMHETSANNGYSGTILKIAVDGVDTTWTLDTAPVDDVLDDNDATRVYVESSLLKNCTLSHAITTSTQTVGASANYKVNDWLHRATGITNAYTNQTNTEISLDAGITPYHFDRNESCDLDGTYDREENFYPFVNDKPVLEITSLYADTNKDTNGAITDTDVVIHTDVGMNTILAAGNIIKLTTGGDVEYMKVNSVNEKSIVVERGYNGSNAVAHGDNTSILVNGVQSIYQTVDKDLLTDGEEYTLSFYVKGVTTTAGINGAIALTYNGSCFDSSGVWAIADSDVKKGYVSDPSGRTYTSSTSNIAQEKKWIEFTALHTDVRGVDEDNLLTSSGWRRFYFTFTLPKEMKVLSDLGIEFTNLGQDRTSFGLDQLDLIENNIMYTTSNLGFGMTSVLDNSGIKDLIVYNNQSQSFSVLKDVFSVKNPLVEFESIESSNFVSNNIDANTFAVSKNNRELHIGMGGTEASSYPEWIGYLNHKLFGQDYTDTLYRDEDTVHKYESGGGSALSKITVAGEFEYLAATWNGSDTLDITHTAHKLVVGDNIVIREWADSAAEWTGKGVWTVTGVPDANSIECQRYTVLDNNPDNNGFLNTSNPAARGTTNTGRICYRPFYYYGIREGDNRLYRITPKARLTGETTIAEDVDDYIEGKIERSLPLPMITTSIATCYSKVDEGGLGGGHVYIISKDSHNITKIDTMVAYNKWTETVLNYTSFQMEFKAFKWSNERDDGNITATQGVFGGLSNVSTPDINPNGYPSDVLETKGPNKDFVHDTQTLSGNDTEHFDTRLWVQFHPGGNNSFPSGSRFIFCARSTSTNTVTGATMYMADRTPATTQVSNYNRYGWIVGIGDESTDYATAGRMSVPVAHAEIHSSGSSRKYFYYTSIHVGSDVNEGGPNAMEKLGGRTQNSHRTFDYDRGSQEDDGSHVPYINFGENIGFLSTPSIAVPKYGLFAISDNDKDGLLDGTGIVVPSTKTLDTIGYTDAEFENPYGNPSQRVTAHAVGIIAEDKNSAQWFRRAGRIQGLPGGNSPHNTNQKFQSAYSLWGTMSNSTDFKVVHEAPTSATMNKFVWICADMHLGDNPLLKKNFDYTAVETTADDVDSSGSSVADTALCKFTVSQTSEETYALQAGDIIFINPSSGQDFANGLPSGDGEEQSQGISATVVAIDHDSRKITTNLRWADYGATGAGQISPYTSYYPWDSNDSSDSNGGTGGGWEGHRGMPPNSRKHYHFCYDEDDALNGECFNVSTNTRSKSFYTKTWYTSPAAIDGWWGSPGILYNIDKLNYRGGAMMRPFSTDFSLLEIDNHLAVDIPSFPEQVYHVRNGNYRHYNVNSSGVELVNTTASRLFVASKSSVSAHSYIWAIDLEPKYSGNTYNMGYTSSGGNLDIGNGVPVSGVASSWNDLSGHSSYLEGTIDADCFIDSAASRHLANATRNPVLQIGASITSGSSFLINRTRGWSVQGRINSLAGCCIVIKCQTTGMTQTRYIVSSINSNVTNPTTTLYLGVHYPFAKKPLNGDSFTIFGHADIVTSQINLIKHVPLNNDSGTDYKSQPHTNQLIPMFSKDFNISSIYDNGSFVFVTTTKPHNIEFYDTANAHRHDSRYTIVNTGNYNGIYEIHEVTSPTTFTVPQSYQIGISHATENTGSILSNSYSAMSNPILAETYIPMMKATFGGLDLRNYRNVTVSSADDDGNHLALTSTAHKMDTGDEIVYDSGEDNEANYTMRDGGANEIDIFTNDSASDGGTVYKENFELFTIEKGGSSKRGYIRSGFSRWDLGHKDKNILAHRSATPRHFSTIEALVEIAPASGSAAKDFFKADTDYKYRVSLIYDGYQEGPLSDGRFFYNGSDTRSVLAVKISIAEVSKRLTHVCLYRKDSAFDYYKLVEEIPTDEGWEISTESALTTGLFTYTVTDDGSLGASYEARTGMSEILDVHQVKYGLSAKVDGYLFVGDCAHEKIINGSNMLFRSRPGMFSLFDYVNDTATLESKPTALVNFNGRLYAFDKSNIYRINQQTLSVEDVFEGVGCLNKNSVIVTEYGMFFADKNGAYMHNGSMPAKISAPIHRGGDITTTFGGTDNIKDVSWDNVVTKSDSDNVSVFYDSNISCVLFQVNYLGLETDGTSKSIQYIWSYHLIQKRWDLWELSENSSVGKPFNGDDGSVYIPINNAIFQHRGGANKRDYTWISKKLSMNEDSSVKVFNRVKLNAVSNNVNLGGDYAESSDRLLIATNSGLIASDDVTYSSKDTGHSQYKLSGSNKKGRWLQFKLENMVEDVDSVGIIFRKKPIK